MKIDGSTPITYPIARELADTIHIVVYIKSRESSRGYYTLPQVGQLRSLPAMNKQKNFPLSSVPLITSQLPERDSNFLTQSPRRRARQVVFAIFLSPDSAATQFSIYTAKSRRTSPLVRVVISCFYTGKLPARSIEPPSPPPPRTRPHRHR